MQALRVQADKRLYSWLMKLELERTPNLDLKQGRVDELLLREGSVSGVRTSLGHLYEARAVVVTTGTFLRGRLITGDTIREGGRDGEGAAMALSDTFRDFGFELGRLKTGTPPRVDARTIDFSQTSIQPGSEEPLYFSFAYPEQGIFHPDNWMERLGPPNPVYPQDEAARRASAWRPQLPCYLVSTNREFHEIVRANLDRAPMFTGIIEGVGPRYCPSIEDKIVRFADKESHGFFLEPEGWQTTRGLRAGLQHLAARRCAVADDPHHPRAAPRGVDAHRLRGRVRLCAAAPVAPLAGNQERSRGSSTRGS